MVKSTRRLRDHQQKNDRRRPRPCHPLQNHMLPALLSDAAQGKALGDVVADEIDHERARDDRQHPGGTQHAPPVQPEADTAWRVMIRGDGLRRSTRRQGARQQKAPPTRNMKPEERAKPDALNAIRGDERSSLKKRRKESAVGYKAVLVDLTFLQFGPTRGGPPNAGHETPPKESTPSQRHVEKSMRRSATEGICVVRRARRNQ